MGAWGTGLYSDDTTCDVRDDFKAQLESGASPAAAEKAILDACGDVISEHQVACLVYFALADTEWRFGCLSKRIKKRALDLLDAGGDVSYWEGSSPESVRARTKALATLRSRLMKPPPPPKKIKRKMPRPPKEQIDFSVGTVFTLALPKGESAALVFVGSHGVETTGLSYQLAVFRLLPWQGKELPALSALKRIASRPVLMDDFDEFSLHSGDARSNPTKRLVPTDLVVPMLSPIDESQIYSVDIEVLPQQVKRALARVKQKKHRN